MTLLSNTAESGLAPGTVVTLGNSANPNAFTGVVGDVQYASLAMRGSRGFLVTAPAFTVTYVDWSNVSGATNAAAIRFYAYFPTTAANNYPLVSFRSPTGAQSLFALWRTPAQQMFLSSDPSGGVVYGTTTGTTANTTWYRFEFAGTNGTSTNGTMTLRVYLGHSTSPIANLSLDVTGANLGTSVIGAARFGHSSANSTSPWAYNTDDLAFQTGSSTLIGPATNSHDGAGNAVVSVNATGVGSRTTFGSSVASVNANATGSGYKIYAGAGAASAIVSTTGVGGLLFTGSGTLSATFTTTGNGTFSTPQIVNGAGSALGVATAQGVPDSYAPNDVVILSTVTGTFLEDDGDPVQGYVILTPGVGFRVWKRQVKLVKIPKRVVPLVNGTFTIPLVASDTWTWTCDVVSPSFSYPQTIKFQVPTTQTAIDVADYIIE